ncbi:MAG: hypothetical protein ACXW0Z_15595, partial [Gemmatirosa sp.]
MAILVATTVGCAGRNVTAGPPPVAGLRDYRVLIASEVTDEIATVRFRGDSSWVERTDMTGF